MAGKVAGTVFGLQWGPAQREVDTVSTPSTPFTGTLQNMAHPITTPLSFLSDWRDAVAKVNAHAYRATVTPVGRQLARGATLNLEVAAQRDPGVYWPHSLSLLRDGVRAAEQGDRAAALAFLESAARQTATNLVGLTGEYQYSPDRAGA